MSSLDHDRLLEQRPKASRTAARPGTATEVPKPRRSPRSSQEKAEGERPRATRTRTAAPVAKATAEKGATGKAAVATSAAGKAVAPRTGTRRTSSPGGGAVPSKAAPAKRAAAKPAAAKPAARKPAARKPAARKPAAAKPAAAKPAASATSASRAAGATGPSPVKRTAVAAPATTAPAEPTAPPAAVAAVPAEAPAVAAPVATAPARAALRRRLRLSSAPRRRSAALLAAALVGALGVGLFSTGSDHAVASESHAVSVAHVLGLTGKQSAAPSAAADQLRLVAASRAQRQSEEAAAAQAQSAADQAAIEAARPKAVLPVNGATLTTCFCMRWGAMHWGIDLAAPLGTPEYAAMDGVVVKAGPASGFGQAVYIQHANGDVTVYGHMEKILVTTGQVVHAGDTIALLGEEGESTGPHLHFEVHVGGIQGQKIDPIPWLRDRGVQI